MITDKDKTAVLAALKCAIADPGVGKYAAGLCIDACALLSKPEEEQKPEALSTHQKNLITAPLHALLALPELNMNNYTEDEVAELNDKAVEASLLAERALAVLAPASPVEGRKVLDENHKEEGLPYTDIIGEQDVLDLMEPLASAAKAVMVPEEGTVGFDDLVGGMVEAMLDADVVAPEEDDAWDMAAQALRFLRDNGYLSSSGDKNEKLTSEA